MTTVANQSVPGGAAAGKTMKSGSSSGTREGYLGTGAPADGKMHMISAGTLGGATGAGGKNQTVGGSAAPQTALGAKAEDGRNKNMKIGKGSGAKKGLRAGYL